MELEIDRGSCGEQEHKEKHNGLGRDDDTGVERRILPIKHTVDISASFVLEKVLR